MDLQMGNALFPKNSILRSVYDVMRQRQVAIFLGLMYALVILRPMLPRLLFEINRAYIASDLCVQRDVKNNTCQGKCYLRKQMQRQQQRERPLANLIAEQLQLTQLQPSHATAHLWVGVVARISLPIPCDATRHDQHIADMPVPPPWCAMLA